MCNANVCDTNVYNVNTCNGNANTAKNKANKFQEKWFEKTSMALCFWCLFVCYDSFSVRKRLVTDRRNL